MKIEPQPSVIPHERALNWLAEKDNHVLDESGLSDLVRLLIASNNQLEQRVQFLENRSRQHDSFI